MHSVARLRPRPKGPFRTVFSTESDFVVFYYSVVNLLRILIHYSKHSKSVQNVVIHYIFSSESLRVVNSLRIVNSLRVLFLVCRGPLGTVAATPTCSATPFQTQISVRHLPAQGRGGGATPKFFGGCSATPVLHLQNAIKFRESAATRVARQGVPAIVCN